MHFKRLLIVALCASLLGALAWWRIRTEVPPEVHGERPLLESFEKPRVRALYVDNLERSLQLRVERMPTGDWQIVDPLEFPAEHAVIEVLLDSLVNQHARPAPEAEPSKVGLDRPRVVLMVEELVGTKMLTRRIEIGAVDLDHHWAYARVDGQIVRTERALDTTLDRDLHDWRARSLWSIAPRDIVEVHRRGSSSAGPVAPGTDLGFDALLDGVWRATRPFEAQLDPDAFGRFVLALATLRAEFFIDSPGPLAFYGLDPASVEFEVVKANGESEGLMLVPEPQGELWYVARRGQPHVYRISSDAVFLVLPPPEVLVDRELVRVAVESVESVELGWGGVETLLRKTERGWRVDGRRDGTAVVSDEPADVDLVLDLIGDIQRTRLDDLLLQRSWQPEARMGHVLITAGGEPQGGTFGPAFSTADGVAGFTFQRQGDRLVALVSNALAELAQREPAHWRTLDLHKIPEIEVARIDLEHSGRVRTYARDDKGKWVRHGASAEAREFVKHVDGLLTMRAQELLPRGSETLSEPLSVRVHRYSGGTFDFLLGLWTPPGGEPTSVYRTGERFARVKPETYAALVSMLAAD